VEHHFFFQKLFMLTVMLLVLTKVVVYTGIGVITVMYPAMFEALVGRLA
jgi:hypothetical protein